MSNYEQRLAQAKCDEILESLKNMKDTLFLENRKTFPSLYESYRRLFSRVDRNIFDTIRKMYMFHLTRPFMPMKDIMAFLRGKYEEITPTRCNIAEIVYACCTRHVREYLEIIVYIFDHYDFAAYTPTKKEKEADNELLYQMYQNDQVSTFSDYEEEEDEKGNLTYFEPLDNEYIFRKAVKLAIREDNNLVACYVIWKGIQLSVDNLEAKLLPREKIRYKELRNVVQSSSENFTSYVKDKLSVLQHIDHLVLMPEDCENADERIISLVTVYEKIIDALYPKYLPDMCDKINKLYLTWGKIYSRLLLFFERRKPVSYSRDVFNYVEHAIRIHDFAVFIETVQKHVIAGINQKCYDIALDVKNYEVLNHVLERILDIEKGYAMLIPDLRFDRLTPLIENLSEISAANINTLLARIAYRDLLERESQEAFRQESQQGSQEESHQGAEQENELYGNLSDSERPEATTWEPEIVDTKTEDVELACVVCKTNERIISFLPCGHKHTCGACTKIIMCDSKLCPICRKPSTGYVRVWQ